MLPLVETCEHMNEKITDEKAYTEQPAIGSLTIAISSRALFDLSESHEVFETEGLDAYQEYQIEREDDPLEKGTAFNLVQKLLKLNEELDQAVEVILLSRNSADTGLRIFNSIQHYELNITRAAFCGGNSPYRYIQPFGCNLFLSTDGADVRQALNQGVAAATILPSRLKTSEQEQLKIAFDGDSVIFSDESEKIFREQGLGAFAENEKKAARKLLADGPFKPFLSALQGIQRAFEPEKAPIRTFLVTARTAPAHERVVRTLRHWNIRIDESLFIGSCEKSKFLEALGADVFFDDLWDNCDSVRNHVATGHVPHGVLNN